MADKTPIVETDNVVDIGDLRVARGYSRRPIMMCHHHQIVIDEKERRLWCKDCEQEVDPYDYIKVFITQYRIARSKLIQERDEIEESKRFSARLIATRVLEKAWRKKNTVPCCPHCKRGISPEDVAQGVQSMDKNLASRVNKPGRENG